MHAVTLWVGALPRAGQQRFRRRRSAMATKASTPSRRELGGSASTWGKRRRGAGAIGAVERRFGGLEQPPLPIRGPRAQLTRGVKRGRDRRPGAACAGLGGRPLQLPRERVVGPHRGRDAVTQCAGRGGRHVARAPVQPRTHRDPEAVVHRRPAERVIEAQRPIGERHEPGGQRGVGGVQRGLQAGDPRHVRRIGGHAVDRKRLDQPAAVLRAAATRASTSAA